MKRPHRDQARIICAIAALVCAAVVFTLLFSAYARRFDRTMTQENRSRLEEVSSHVAAYMELAVEQQQKELRMTAAVCAVLPDRAARVAYLGRMAEELDFVYIGLAEEDGLLRAAAFREPQDISGEDYFQAALRGEASMTGLRRHIFWDRAVSGILLSVPAPEGTGAAVVAMLSTAQLEAAAWVDSFEGNGFSYIIDGEGVQVLHARSMAYSNLFQALQNLPFEEGYSLDAMRADIAARREGMTAYSDLGVEKYAYYRPLSFNDWTVVSIVPKGVVTARTAALSRELIVICAAAALVFLGLLSAVGLLLLRLESRRRANRAKSDFLANMSHDMRTPMNAIMGMAAIASAHAGEPDTVRDCMGKIGFSSQHLLGLINDVLDLSRVESGKMTLAREPYTLSGVLESVENMTLPRVHAKGQHFSVRLYGVEHEAFLGDSLRLSQVFVNLLTNAMKFTPEGGRITVDVEELPGGAPGAAPFRFTFTDTGIGMSQAFLKDLFTPFTRERNSRVDSTEGSGLGMAITKRIVDLMGGRIEVRSEEGRGSVFTVTLPLELDGAAPRELPPPAWRVLLAGGDGDQGAESVRTLEALGLSAAFAADLDDAGARLAEETYEAVLVDRLVYSARGVARLRRAAGSAVLLLAAYDWEDIREEAVGAGVNHFVQKPLLGATLSRALRRAADREDGSPPPQPEVDLSGRRVLLAEDNAINLEIVRALLSERGATTLWAPDGEECVTLFLASPPGSIDLILMDIQMPRMDGCEAAARIRASARPDASVPILAMSANAYAEDMDAAARAGMDGYLTKPIDLPVWLVEIGRVLGAAAPPAEE